MIRLNWATIQAVISNEAKSYPIKFHSVTNMNIVLDDLSDDCK
jgi:hypothetical protein